MGSFMALLTLAFCLLASGVRAADDNIMPMRGEGPEGKVQVNQFQRGTEWGGGILANSGTTEAAVKLVDYVGWHDDCVRTPRMVAGQVVDVDASGGFELAPPLIRRPEMEDGGFLDALAREFAQME